MTAYIKITGCKRCGMLTKTGDLKLRECPLCSNMVKDGQRWEDCFETINMVIAV
jgi:hypothetical protein